MEKEQNNKKIGIVPASAMVSLALIFDLISLIPIINIVSGLIAWLIFGTWFYFLGAGLLNPKKFATVSLSFLAELIPFVSILPATTIGVCVLIFMQNHPAVGNLVTVGTNPKKSFLGRKSRGSEVNQPTEKKWVKKSTDQESTFNPLPVSNQKNKESEVSPAIKNLANYPNQIPQRRFIRDIDPPAPYGEDENDQLK